MAYFLVLIGLFIQSQNRARAEGAHSTLPLLLAPLTLGIVGGKPLNPKDEMHKKFVRLSNTGKTEDTDCTGVNIDGCTLTGKHCVKNKKLLMAMQGNADLKGQTGIKIVDYAFLNGEARTGLDDDLVILKPETLFTKAESFTIDDVESAQPAKGDKVILVGAGYNRIFKGIELKDKEKVETAVKLGIGTQRVGVNEIIGSLGEKEKVLDKVEKDSKNFLVANTDDGDGTFGNVDEGDSGGPAMTITRKDDKLVTKLVGIVSKRLQEKDKIGPSKAGAVVSLPVNREWIKTKLKELKCSAT